LELNEALGNRFSYEIYSIDGKNILKGQMNENPSIKVETLESGMCFLAISFNENYRQTLKFLKQ
jgi:hypothetical protein